MSAACFKHIVSCDFEYHIIRRRNVVHKSCTVRPLLWYAYCRYAGQSGRRNLPVKFSERDPLNVPRETSIYVLTLELGSVTPSERIGIMCLGLEVHPPDVHFKLYRFAARLLAGNPTFCNQSRVERGFLVRVMVYVDLVSCWLDLLSTPCCSRFVSGFETDHCVQAAVPSW